MVITTLIASLALAPTPLEFKVVSASMFKNGYAVVVREAPLRGSGDYTAESVPTAVLGTMWVTASPGVRIERLVYTQQEVVTEASVQTFDEIIRANVGKTMSFRSGDKVFEGKLLSADGELLILQEGSGMRVLRRNTIQEVFSESELVWKVESKGTKPVMQMQVTSGAGAKVYIASLERGLTWMPSYALELLDKDTVRLTSKATILNDLADLDNLEVRLITGFPNVPFIGYWDPLTSRQTVDQFVNSLMSMGTPEQLRDRAVGFANQAPAPASRNFGEAFGTNTLPGITAEDLFFYRLPGVRMKKGDRGYFILFNAESQYSHIYEWDIPDKINNSRYSQEEERPGDVWHSIRFENTAKQPLTTGPATIFKEGELLGQDSLTYTSAGAPATIKMTKALDVRAEDLEEETGRQVLTEPIRGNWYDVVTLKGTLSITNRKSEAVELRITKELTGEVVAADLNPKIRAITRGLRAVNPRHLLEWTLPLKAGETRTVTYSYKVHLLR